MAIIRRKPHEMPALNTSSLPDLIFTVLFFFMIVTHMRKHEVKVSYQVPQGKELTSVGNKRNVVDLYIGRPLNTAEREEGTVAVQVDDKEVALGELSSAMAERMAEFSEIDRDQVIVSLKADASTPMSVINEAKLALRKAGALKVSYSATEIKTSE